jgi:hypothetical protein
MYDFVNGFNKMCRGFIEFVEYSTIGTIETAIKYEKI